MRKDEEAAKVEAFSAGMQKLMDFYAEHGCPCRFPRFRAAAALDSRDVGVPSCTTFDHMALVTLFDTRFPLKEKKSITLGHEGLCAACGSAIKRWGEEHFRDAWIEYMRVTPAAGSVDLGADVHGPVPRCWPFFAVGPAERDALHMVELSYPKVPMEDWFSWLRGLRV